MNDRLETIELLPVNPLWKGIVVGIASALIAVLLRELLGFAFDQDETPFLLFPASIIVAARIGGLRAGVTTLAVTSLYSFFRFVPLVPATDPNYITPLIKTGVFIFEGGIICSLIGVLQQTRKTAVTNEAKAILAEKFSRDYYEQVLTTQEELNALETTYRDLIDSNVIGMMLCSFEGKFYEANDAFLDLLEYTRDDLQNNQLNWISLTPKDFRDRDLHAIEELKKHRRIPPFELQLISKTGLIRNVLIGAASTGTGDKFIAFVLDRSENAQFQDELQTALNLAETANRTKTEFLANISHELRTPLNAIIGMTDLALDEDISDVMRDYIQTARDAAQTLTFLINDVLDFSRMETGHFELDADSFELPNLVEQTLKTLSLRAHQKGLELISHISPQVPRYVNGDKNRIRQIIVNVVSNAIKFTEQGEVFVDVSLTDDETENDQINSVNISVLDTGIGISKEDQTRIFSPFTQVDASTTRNYVGTGLGLAICQEIISRMDGRIEVTSEPGEGSRFDIIIPLESGVQTVSTPTRSITIDDFHGARVLIVDDNETSLRTLKSTLENWSMCPETATTAAEAMQKLKDSPREDSEESYRVLLVDGLMPQMDGFEFLENMKKDGILPEASLMMLSSADRMMFETRCESAPVDAFIEKPISQSTLMDTLVSLLSGRVRPKTFEKRIRPTKYEPLTILVAEDTPVNQKVVEQILRKRGHNVILANNGREALDLYYENDFDLILMDMQMPTMDGLQATKAIRNIEDPDEPLIPIIALTAHTMKGDRERCIDAGASDYLSKPVDAEALLDMIEKLARRSGRKSTRIPTKTDKPRDEFAIPEKFHGALQRMGNDAVLFCEMISMYCDDFPQLFEELQTEVAAENWETAGHHAHRLKGLVYSFGTSLPPCETILVIEQKIKDQGSQLLDSLLTRYENELNKLKDELQDVRGKIQSIKM